MTKKRSSGKKSQVPLKALCSGPSKLCQAFDITKDNSNAQDLTEQDADLWVEDGPEVDSAMIVTSTRVGIEGCGAESASKPYRFYEKDNIHVSVLDKEDKKMKSLEKGVKSKRLKKDS